MSVLGWTGLVERRQRPYVVVWKLWVLVWTVRRRMSGGGMTSPGMSVMWKLALNWTTLLSRVGLERNERRLS